MVRGFTREVLSIVSWAAAAVAALYFTPRSLADGSLLFHNDGLAQIGFAAGVFFVTLIVVSLITFRISDRVLDSRVGALDRTLGFIFGLARGFLLVAIAFILFSALARDQTGPGSPRPGPARSSSRPQVAIVADAAEPGAVFAMAAGRRSPGRPACGARDPAWRASSGHRGAAARPALGRAEIA